MSHIFISYSRRDIDLAGKIVQALAENDLDTWIDWKSIPKGEDWEHEIHRGIEEADAFLFLISPDSIISEMCNKEIAHAVANGKRILPIVIRDANVEQFLYKDAKVEISKRNWIFCSDRQDDFNKAIEETRKTIHTDYEWLKYHTELQVKALKWEQKKDNSRLLRGKELHEAEEQLAKAGSHKDPQPTELHRNYVLTSQRNDVRQRRQISIGLGAGLIIVSVLAIFALVQRNTAQAETNSRATTETNAISEANARATAQADAEEQARIAKEQASIALSRQLIAQTTNQLDQGDWELAFLLAIEAGRSNESSDTFSVLREVIAHPGQTKFILTGVIDAKWNFDGSRILAISYPDNMTVSVWNAVTGEKIFTISDFMHRVTQAMWNLDGSRILTVTEDRVVNCWNSQTGKKIFTISDFTHRVTETVWSPDGSRILTVTEDGVAKVWNAENGAELKTEIFNFLKSVRSNQVRANWSPDGKNIIIIGCSQLDNADNDCSKTTAQKWNITSDTKPLLLFTSKTYTAGLYLDGLSWNSLGTRLMTFSWNDKKASVWDSATGIEKFAIPDIEAAKWNKNGNQILTLGVDDRKARVWDAKTGVELFIIPSVDQVSWNKDGDQILAVSRSDHTSNVWDSETGNKIFTLNSIDEAEWDHIGNRILTLSSNKSNLQIWDVGTGLNLMTASWDSNRPLYSILMNNSGSQFLIHDCYFIDILKTPCTDVITEIWDTKTGTKLFSFLEHSGSGSGIWSPDENQIMTNSSVGVVRVANIYPGREIPVSFFNSEYFGNPIINFDGTRVLAIGANQVEVWDIKTGSEVITLYPSGEFIDAAWNLDGSLILTVSSTESSKKDFQVWDSNSGRMLLRIPGSKQVEISPRKAYILTINHDNLCQMWDLEKHTVVFSLLQCENARWSPDDEYILTVNGEELAVWNVATRAEMISFHIPDLGNSYEIMWSPRGDQILVVTWNDNIQVWDANTGKIKVSIPNDPYGLSNVAWHPYEDLFLIATNNEIHIWNTQIGRSPLDFKPDIRVIYKAEWNPMGTRILTWVTYHALGTVQLWNPYTGKEIGDLGLVKNVGDLVWDPKGNQVMTFADNIAWVWDAETGKELFSLPSVGWATWLADGRRLLSIGSDGIRLWYTNMSDLTDAACQQVPRNMTHAEWNQYIGEDIPYRATCPNLPTPTE